MVDVLTSIDINAPLQKVADYASNPDNAPEWYVNIKSVLWKTYSPLQIGSRVAFVANFLMKELSYTYEVVEYSGQTFVMKTAEGPFPMETTYTFAAISANVTRMTLRNKGKPSGFLGVFTPFISLMMKQANKKIWKNSNRSSNIRVNENPGNISKLTDELFRHESGKLIAILTRIFGTQNLQLAEDVVQETFISALQTWRIKGVPDNPAAWLFRSAKNKTIDLIRKNKHSIQMDFSENERQLYKSEYTLSTVMNNMWTDTAIEDDLLKMMFACCHEEIINENQITLILKTLCGFTTAEIAKAFLTSEDTISKRLYRTKEFFREKKIRPEIPATNLLRQKTEAVLKSIYLIFNEGYSSTHSDELIRKDLLEQAMYLCQLLCNNPKTQIAEVYAAMALMHFHAARIESRISAEGEIILLAHQDRTKWKVELIETGNDYMNKSAFGGAISSYHLEAAIAYEHCIAPSFEKTNWPQILAYYDLLARFYPTPVVMLNRIAVIYKINGPDQALPELKGGPFLKEWENHYLYYSLLGEIYSSTDTTKAKASFEKAISLTRSKVERNFLRYKIDRLLH